jgi:hypothetical protein
MTMLWCKIMPKTIVEQIEGNEKGRTPIHAPLGA